MIALSVVLIGMGVRMIVQQEELAEKHAADERRLRVSDFERDLVTRLDRIRENRSDPAVAIAGTLADGRLLLPWDRASDGARDIGFREAISSAERAEFGTGRIAVAESRARAAL